MAAELLWFDIVEDYHCAVMAEKSFEMEIYDFAWFSSDFFKKLNSRFQRHT